MHTHAEHTHGAHGHVHHEPFLTKYFFSRDHKRIGVQFLLSALLMFVIGGLLALGLRWHLAYPNKDFPFAAMLPNNLLDKVPANPIAWESGFPLEITEDYKDNGVSLTKGQPATFKKFTEWDNARKYRPVPLRALVSVEGKDYDVPIVDPKDISTTYLGSKTRFHKVKNESYSTMFTMHGSVMIFLVIIPLMVGAFANFAVPLMIGARDMAFPTLNMISYWLFPPAAVILLYGTFLDGGAAGPGAGWTSYPPIAIVDTVKAPAQVCWLLGVLLLGTSSILGSLNYITTIVKMRAPGMGFFRMPLTVWAVFITSILVAFATPVLAAALLMQLMDHTLHTSFFLPSNLMAAGSNTLFQDQINNAIAQKTGVQGTVHVGGGQPLLWQHLFWFYSHPAVYIMILPAMGIVSDVLSTFARKPIFGYRPMIYAIAAIAGLGFIVWGHHMFVSGMNPALGTTFTLSTIMIALPSAIKVFNWLGTLWGGTIQFTTAMLNALAFVAMFVIGGLSGIFMAATPVDLYIHDTYFIVAHLHYVLFGGSVFGAFAGVYYWFPKMFGRMMNETWGKIHFVLTFVAYNCTFFTMHILGMGGMPRRYASFEGYHFLDHLKSMNEFVTISAILLGAVQIIFAINFFWSMFAGPKAPPNPWNANTLEWQTPSPPGHGNFETTPRVYRGPYEYSSPEVHEDWLPQNKKLTSPATA